MSQKSSSLLQNEMLGRGLVPDSKVRIDALRPLPGLSQFWRNPAPGRSGALLVPGDSTGWDPGTVDGGAWPNIAAGGYKRAIGELASMLAADAVAKDANVIYWLDDFTNGNYYYQAPRVLHTGTGGLQRATLPGLSGYTLFHNKTKANAFTGTHHWVSGEASAVDWTPGGNLILASDWGPVGQQAWSFGLFNDGKLWFSYSTDGTNSFNRFSTVATGLADGTVKHIGVDIQWNNGAGGNTFTFYTSADGHVWTQLGAAVTNAGVLTPVQTTAPYQIGCRTIGGSAGTNWNGDVYGVQIRSGGMYGPTLLPLCVDQWEQNPNNPGWPAPGLPFNPFHGSPTLHIVNASWPGMGLTQFDDATYLPLLVPHFPYLGVILNTGHNDSVSGVTARAMADKWDRVLARIERRAPEADFAVLTQNPTLRTDAALGDTASLRYDHTARMARLASYAHARGMSVIDTYQTHADWSGGSGLTDLLDPSGGPTQIIHPYGPGVTRQAQKIYDEVFAA